MVIVSQVKNRGVLQVLSEEVSNEGAPEVSSPAEDRSPEQCKIQISLTFVQIHDFCDKIVSVVIANVSGESVLGVAGSSGCSLLEMPHLGIHRECCRFEECLIKAAGIHLQQFPVPEFSNVTCC
ncbi:UNVERIFIED_CONTAM: hypothetical protein FKN15_043291 [Acipenser sinensis]